MNPRSWNRFRWQRVRQAMEIAAHPERVWQLLLDPGKIEPWTDRFGAIVPLSEGPIAAGYRCRWRLRIPSRLITVTGELEMEVEVFEPGRRMLLRGKGGPAGSSPDERMEKIIDYRLTSTPRGTLLAVEITDEVPGFCFLARPLTWLAGKWELRDELRRLKVAAENSPA